MNSARNLLLIPVLIASAVHAEVVDSTLELNGVTKVKLNGPYSLEIKQGNEEFVTVTTEQSNLENVEAVIEDGVLQLGEKHHRSWHWFGDDRVPAKFTVQVRSLDSVMNRGSGDIKIDAFDTGNDLQLEMNGSGEMAVKEFRGGNLFLDSRGSGDTRIGSANIDDFSLQNYGSGDVHIDTLNAKAVIVSLRGSSDVEVEEGTADSVEVSVYGSGDVEFDVMARTATVSIHGSGDVEINATESLDVSIYGSGDVEYGGNPTNVTRNVRGSGDISAR